MKKIKVLFPFVEAGLGHIMPMKAILEKFEKKYGDQVEIIKTFYFSDSHNKELIKYENTLINNVKAYSKYHFFGHFATFNCEFWGTKISTWGAMRFIGPRSTKPGIDLMEAMNPDVVISTHWSTNYYAKHSKYHPMTIEYCPDATLNKLFRYPADLTLISMSTGYRKGMKTKEYNDDNFKLVPFAIRNEAFSVSLDKYENRKRLNLPMNNFTITMIEGGYGVGMMKKMCEILAKKHLNLTIIAICGKNKPLYEYLKTIPCSPEVTLIPQEFITNVFDYEASSDLFLGKSGNVIAEPTFFGVPSIITSFSTLIERDIGNYYIKEIKCALNGTRSAKKDVRLIEKFYEHPELLIPYQENARKHHDAYGADMIVDVIWNKIVERFPEIDKAREEVHV